MMPAETMIHPSAIIASNARIGAGVEIGPYCVIGGDVTLGDGVRLISHVTIEGLTEIGVETVIYPFASIGHPPQDMKFKGEKSQLTIGERCQIREYVTINPGTEGGGMVTKVGSDCLLMVGSHVAHDCLLGDHVILANNATLAGHVVVGDYAFIGGLSAVHQFVRIGTQAMIGGMSGVEQDVIPYGLVMGERARLSGLNLVGLERRGIPRTEISSLRSAYRMLFGPDGTLAERIEEVSKHFTESDFVTTVLDFMAVKSSRALCQPKTLNSG
jgi:UDP-N-acetylglucosamine acyltransferase